MNYSEQTGYLLEVRDRLSGAPIPSEPRPDDSDMASFINRLLINHTDYLCEATCMTCGKGKQFDLKTIKRMITYLSSYPGTPDKELGDHLVHVETDSQCMVCMFGEGELGDSIRMYRKTKETPYGKYEYEVI